MDIFWKDKETPSKIGWTAMVLVAICFWTVMIGGLIFAYNHWNEVF